MQLTIYQSIGYYNYSYNWKVIFDQRRNQSCSFKSKTGYICGRMLQYLQVSFYYTTHILFLNDYRFYFGLQFKPGTLVLLCLRLQQGILFLLSLLSKPWQTFCRQQKSVENYLPNHLPSVLRRNTTSPDIYKRKIPPQISTNWRNLSLQTPTAENYLPRH